MGRVDGSGGVGGGMRRRGRRIYPSFIAICNLALFTCSLGYMLVVGAGVIGSTPLPAGAATPASGANSPPPPAGGGVATGGINSTVGLKSKGGKLLGGKTAKADLKEGEKGGLKAKVVGSVKAAAAAAAATDTAATTKEPETHSDPTLAAAATATPTPAPKGAGKVEEKASGKNGQTAGQKKTESPKDSGPTNKDAQGVAHTNPETAAVDEPSSSSGALFFFCTVLFLVAVALVAKGVQSERRRVAREIALAGFGGTLSSSGFNNTNSSSGAGQQQIHASPLRLGGLRLGELGAELAGRAGLNLSSGSGTALYTAVAQPPPPSSGGAMEAGGAGGGVGLDLATTREARLDWERQFFNDDGMGVDEEEGYEGDGLDDGQILTSGASGHRDIHRYGGAANSARAGSSEASSRLQLELKR